jgi:ADP-heptose:LPS heptosyltransferase
MYWLTTYKKLGHRFKKRHVVSTFLSVWSFYIKNWRSPQKRNTIPATLLIVRFDLIGDYVLFRNVLVAIRNSEFKNYRITLCGNSVYKNLAENLDDRIIDDFIWIKRSRFLQDKAYHFNVLQRINQAGFEVAFQPTFSREKFGDLLINASQADRRIGVDGDLANQTKAQRHVTDTFYTQLIKVDPPPNFEFFRNKEVVAKFIHQNVNIARPAMTLPDVDQDLSPAEDFAVLVVGASHSLKQWPHFWEIVEYIVNQLHLKIVLVGHGKQDRRTIGELVQKSATSDFVNLCDQTSLLQLAHVLKRAKLVVSNDTAAVHIAAVLGSPTVCITLGAHAFRFNNYPKDLDVNIRFVFPKEIELLLNEVGFKHYQTQYKNEQSIKSIPAIRIVQSIKEVMACAS